ncbi:unnamed protein product [Rotaria sp. Silwood2]|nr:unnamed protein product [Rotaria sp. Silwood2]CAF4192772.1 unnamed protein product [Rotaria sp. Silwood2]CAF4239685.1 unnamed protein product [Rotaria sp. Silwood2]
MEPKLVCYFLNKQFSKSPIYHVGYLGRDMLFVVSNDCAAIKKGSKKGDYIIHSTVLDKHRELGQFYMTIRD